MTCFGFSVFSSRRLFTATEFTATEITANAGMRSPFLLILVCREFVAVNAVLDRRLGFYFAVAAFGAHFHFH
jgi:hypothetical protein